MALLQSSLLSQTAEEGSRVGIESKPLEEILNPERTAIVVVDVQERVFCGPRYAEDIAFEKRLVEFLGGVGKLQNPVKTYWIEYEHEWNTLESLKEALGRKAPQKPLEKTGYSAMSESACGLPMALRRAWGDVQKEPATLIVVGLFNRAIREDGDSQPRCVAQTAKDAMKAGYRVVLPKDGYMDFVKKRAASGWGRFILPGKFRLENKELARQLWEPSSLAELLGVMQQVNSLKQFTVKEVGCECETL